MTTTMIAQLVVWLIIGGLAGAVTGNLAKRGRGGFGWFLNLLLGMAGAFVGGWLFEIFNIDLGVLSQIEIAFDQIVAAIAGSLLVLLILIVVQNWRANRNKVETR